MFGDLRTRSFATFTLLSSSRPLPPDQHHLHPPKQRANSSANPALPLLAFDFEESLEWIKLSENRIPEIPSRALHNLTSLRLLDLRSNNITHIARDAFFNFGKTLTYLYLQNNRWVKFRAELAASELRLTGDRVSSDH